MVSAKLLESLLEESDFKYHIYKRTIRAMRDRFQTELEV